MFVQVTFEGVPIDYEISAKVDCDHRVCILWNREIFNVLESISFRENSNIVNITLRTLCIADTSLI